MNLLRTRLILSYLAVLLTGIVVAASLAWLTVEQLYLETQRANLLAQARLAAAALRDLPVAPVDALPFNQTANLQAGIHTRVLDAQGAVVIDVPTALPLGQEVVAPLPALAQNAVGNVPPQELLARPEIAQALAGQEASAVRNVEFGAARRVLYAAVPVTTPDGAVTRLVYLATPLPATGWSALPVATRRQLASALALAVLLACCLGWWLAGRIVRPLKRLAQAADAVATGDLAQKVPEDDRTVELRTLGRAFNRMTAGLRRADQAKTAFIADVSHELRTPLTVIKGTVETLQDGALDDMHVRDTFLASLATETERLIHLVNDLLMLTRADAGALHLERQTLHLDELARSRVRHFAPLAARRSIALHAPPAAPIAATALPCVAADPHRLTQVLDNLLANALRHTPTGGTVSVSVTAADGGVCCTVADSGSGIADRHLPFIFDRFYRADAARSRSQGGSGLGLAISRALVQAHGGHISAASVEGQGTTITFWLPGEVSY